MNTFLVKNEQFITCNRNNKNFDVGVDKHV